VQRNLAQKICIVCMIVVLVATCILWGVNMDGHMEQAFDHPLSYRLSQGLLLVALGAVLSVEGVFFLTLRGILAPRAYKLWKRLLCAVVFLGNLLAVTWVICYIR